MNHATISRRLHALEERLGAKLAERRPGGYVLTPSGTHALEAASDMEQAVQMLARGTTDGAPSGSVRINASPALSNGFLTSRLAQLVARYPSLDIDLASNHQRISLERHEADIAIRFGRPKGGDVIARPLVSVGYGFYGTDDACRSVEAGSEPVLIGFDEADSYLPEAIWLARHFSRLRLAFRAGDQFAQSIAARSGVGFALIPHYLGRSDPLLRICDLGPVPSNIDFMVLTRRRDGKDPSIRAVVDYITEMFDRERWMFA